jgi:hypothetical protein
MSDNGHPDLLLFGDTHRSAAMRHELPLGILDPFLYAEVGGRRYVLSSSLERSKLEALPGSRSSRGCGSATSAGFASRICCSSRTTGASCSPTFPTS